MSKRLEYSDCKGVRLLMPVLTAGTRTCWLRLSTMVIYTYQAPSFKFTIDLNLKTRVRCIIWVAHAILSCLEFQDILFSRSVCPLNAFRFLDQELMKMLIDVHTNCGLYTVIIAKQACLENRDSRMTGV